MTLMKWNRIPATCLAALLLFAGCSTEPSAQAENEDAAGSTSISSNLETEDLDSEDPETIDATIRLTGESATVEGNGVSVAGSVITITQAGTYRVSGTLTDGQLLVNADKESKVRLIFDGVEITCLDSAPLYIQKADRVILTLASGSENVLTDGETYVYADAEAEEPNAAIFSKDDLTINGEGALTVYANFNNGIQCKDDLEISGGTISVTAAHNGIKGKDSVTIRDAGISVSAGGDGIQSDQDEDAEKGYVRIESGTVSVEAEEDGIQAETTLQIEGGTISVTSGGASNGRTHTESFEMPGMRTTEETSDETSTVSQKGIKAGSAVVISGGTMTIDAADDAVHANGTVEIQGGTLELSTGDDGIHADSSVAIRGGEITVSESYEGIEGAQITISGGDIAVTASDDGLNAADGSGTGWPGQTASGDFCITIRGGTTVVYADGDGIDSNGDIVMTDGTLLIHGPTDNGNGAIDYEGTFALDGGTLIAAGSSGMLQTPGSGSSQYTASILFASAQAAGSPVSISSADGEREIVFTPSKQYTSLIISTPELQEGTTYTVKTGGTVSDAGNGGLGGVYSGGSEYLSAVLSETVTQFAPDGVSAGGIGGMPEMGGQMQEPPGGFTGETPEFENHNFISGY